MDYYFTFGSIGNDWFYADPFNAILLKQKMQKEVMSKTKSFLMKLSIVFGIVVLFFIFYKLSNIVYKQKATSDEIASLQREIDRLNQGNNDLEELINYFQTDQFKEKEAKDKLNLVKEGEQVVFLKEKEIIREEKPAKEKPEIIVNRPNYYWWWHYFFSI